jgi:hypothetical protein
VPTALAILDQLRGIAQTWWPLAVVWHVYVAAFVLAVLAGWRPTRRLAASLVSMPVASALAMAAVSANPFTTLLLGGTIVGTQVALWRWPSEVIQLGRGFPLIIGGALIVFGLVYPHFLSPNSTATYLYAAPTGLVPCPTLAVLAGFSMALRSFGSRWWAFVVAASCLIYGAIGSLYLAVRLDWVLVVGSLVVFGQALWPKAFEANGTPAGEPSR